MKTEKLVEKNLVSAITKIKTSTVVFLNDTMNELEPVEKSRMCKLHANEVYYLIGSDIPIDKEFDKVAELKITLNDNFDKVGASIKCIIEKKDDENVVPIAIVVPSIDFIIDTMNDPIFNLYAVYDSNSKDDIIWKGEVVNKEKKTIQED